MVDTADRFDFAGLFFSLLRHRAAHLIIRAQGSVYVYHDVFCFKFYHSDQCDPGFRFRLPHDFRLPAVKK